MMTLTAITADHKKILVKEHGAGSTSVPDVSPRPRAGPGTQKILSEQVCPQRPQVRDGITTQMESPQKGRETTPYTGHTGSP